MVRRRARNSLSYALGFDGKLLEKTFFDTGFADAFPLTYDDALLAGADSAIIDSYLKLIDVDVIMQSGASISDMAELYTSLSKHLLHAAIFFKHKAYINEKEYRFLRTYSAAQIPRIKWRPRRYSLIRYTEFNWRA